MNKLLYGALGAAFVAATLAAPSAMASKPPVGPCGKPHCPVPTTTTQPAPTTTVAATTTTAAATTTTAVPQTTTTVAATTTTMVMPTTTIPATTIPSTTIAPPAGAFVEDFGSATALTDRVDHGWSGEWNAGALFGDSANDWQADHDMACMNPNTSSRTIHLSGQAQANDAAFFPCTFAGDPAKSHMMTTVNTEGYVTVWFSPKQTFTNVNRVCWDQNITWQGGGKWTEVNFLTFAEYNGQTDLGYTSPDFPSSGASSPQGSAMNGVKMFGGGMDSYTNGTFHGGPGGTTIADKAPRFQHCVRDNGNGTLTMSVAQPNGLTNTGTVSGNIPDGAIRIEFVDDSYNPDKHFFNPEQFVPRDSSGLYTWHWDNVLIETTGGG